MKTKIIGYYSLILGLGVIAYWILVLSAGAYPEGPVEISFHVFSEMLMALICMISGWLLITHRKRGHILNVVGHSMVLYAVLNAAGYFGAQGQWVGVILFLLLFIISILVIGFHIKEVRKM